MVNDYWHGPPDLVIEVLSDSTAKRDHGTKFELYEAHGVREYWIVEPVVQSVVVWTLLDGEYQRHGVFRNDTVLASRVLGDQIIDLRAVFSG